MFLIIFVGYLLNYMNNNILCSVVAQYNKTESEYIMENKENTIDKVAETLTKELESLSDEGLHEFFMFFYKLNHQHGNMIEIDLFEEFLESFNSNPFRINEDKTFRKQLIENILKYSHDHMSLITAPDLSLTPSPRSFSERNPSYVLSSSCKLCYNKQKRIWRSNENLFILFSFFDLGASDDSVRHGCRTFSFNHRTQAKEMEKMHIL